MRQRTSDAQLEREIAMCLATGQHFIVADEPTDRPSQETSFIVADEPTRRPTQGTIARLEAAYAKAFKLELRAVDALDERSSKRAVAHALKLAQRTNAALRALQAAREGK